MIKIIPFDYSLKTLEERSEFAKTLPLETYKPDELTLVGDYIMGGLSKEERKTRKYLTQNRLVTVRKRETSIEGLAAKLENGEDGVAALTIERDPNTLLVLKDVLDESLPALQQLREDIATVEDAIKSAKGARRHKLVVQLIEMRKDQYVLNSIFKPTVCSKRTPASISYRSPFCLTERRYLDAGGNPQSSGLISLFNPDHVVALMQYYYALKAETAGRTADDFYYLLMDFEGLMERALADRPIYQAIAEYKMRGLSNAAIQIKLQAEHNKSYAQETISSTWRRKIPRLIAETAKREFIISYYQSNNLQMRRCTQCGRLLPAHKYFFSPNTSSRSGFYSICKECKRERRK